ncbi:MAG TPA: amidohydrolase family protein [Acidimicrobiia bacterium]|nr:amidohydrolase family protein [Acidimicrobiia bacterium]
MVYDVHAHCIPPDLRTWLESNGGALGLELIDDGRGVCVQFNGGFTSAPMRDNLGDLETRLEAMDRMGVTTQLLAGWIDLTGYDLEAAEGAVYARAYNDSLAEHAAIHPERFLALATLPLQDPSAAAEELRRAMTGLGMIGAQIATTIGSDWLDQRPLDEFWEAAAELEAMILLHPMAPLTGVDLDRYFMSNTIGRPAETTIALAGLIYSGVFDRHPDLVMCVVHGGGFAPFQVGRMNRAYLAKPEVAAKHASRLPADYLSKLYFDTVVHDAGVLRFLIDSIGANQILLGTDYPFEMGDDDPVGLVDSVAGITAAEREAILTGNVERLLGAEE